MRGSEKVKRKMFFILSQAWEHRIFDSLWWLRIISLSHIHNKTRSYMLITSGSERFDASSMSWVRLHLGVGMIFFQ